jgi:hypothetical protein
LEVSRCSRNLLVVVGVLYLGGKEYFGCRHCYNLTYDCQKESGKFDRYFEKLGYNPKEARRVLFRKKRS